MTDVDRALADIEKALQGPLADDPLGDALRALAAFLKAQRELQASFTKTVKDGWPMPAEDMRKSVRSGLSDFAWEAVRAIQFRSVILMVGITWTAGMVGWLVGRFVH